MIRVTSLAAAQQELDAAVAAVAVLNRPATAPLRLAAQRIHQQQLVTAYRRQARAALDLAGYHLPESVEQRWLLAWGTTTNVLVARLDQELLAVAGGR